MKAPIPATARVISQWSVRLARGMRGRPRFLDERRDLEVAASGLLQHLRRLLLRARVELHEQVDDDALVVVLVEADVGEELAGARLAERAVGQRVGRLWAGAGLNEVLVDGDVAGGDPRQPADHALPAVLDR